MAKSGFFKTLGTKIANLWKNTSWFKLVSIGGAVVIATSAVVIHNASISETGGIFHKCDFSIKNINPIYSYSTVNCTEKAKYYYSCACGEKGTELFEYGSALGHDLTNHDSKQVTCTDSGHYEYDSCSRCDYSTYEAIPATGHTDGEWITDIDATCTEDGSKHQVCTICTDTIKTVTIPATGHTDGGWITDIDATCTEDGSKHQVCSICIDTIKTVTIPATGHTAGGWIVDTNATCTANGLKHQDCLVCYEKINDAVIEQLGHIDSDWIYDYYPTCTESGQRHKLCARCEHTYNSETVQKNGHSPGSAVAENEVAATCDTKGYYDSVVYCTIDSCNAEISRKKTYISPTGHNYISYICTKCNSPQSGVKLVYDFEDLQNINNNRSATYVLMNDIDCDGLAITPIGADNATPFSGVFDGCGHKISNYIATNAQ